jgi:SAM-dependent methyltransferase
LEMRTLSREGYCPGVIRFARRLPRDYGEQTYNSPYRIVSYPHQRRCALAIEEVRRARAKTLLDYGAGDGHIVAELAKRSGAGGLERVTLYEPVPAFAQLARERMTETALASSAEVLETLDLEDRKFDFILCLGVLEHMPLPERERFYSLCVEHLAPGGRCLIDVPIEIGPPVVLKEVVRVTLKGRRPEYTPRRLMRTVLFGTVFDPARYAADSDSTWIHYHTGFDHRLFRAELESRFELLDCYGSPFRYLPPSLMNQEIFFVVRPKATDHAASVS